MRWGVGWERLPGDQPVCGGVGELFSAKSMGTEGAWGFKEKVVYPNEEGHRPSAPREEQLGAPKRLQAVWCLLPGRGAYTGKLPDG